MEYVKQTYIAENWFSKGAHCKFLGTQRINKGKNKWNIVLQESICNRNCRERESKRAHEG